MKRKDREVTKLTDLLNIIEHSQVLHIGMCDHGVPYIVPLNFGYSLIDSQVIFYVHTAPHGKKVEILQENSHVCFELETMGKIVSDAVPCRWTTEYESIIGYGDITFITDPIEKKAAMDRIMRKNGCDGDQEYNPEIFSKTALCKLTVSQMTGKSN